MKESETLFYLIRSLSKSEKRSFMLGARTGKEKSYLALYSWYERRKTPANPGRDELRKMRLTPNRLAVQKHYLFHRLLDSLVLTGSGVSEEAKVRLLINKSELLLAKGLTEASLRLLDTAERLAEACFSYQLQLDILLRREAHVLKYEDVQLVQQFGEKKKQLLLTLGNINDYQQLSYAVFGLTRRYDLPATSQQHDALHTICAHPLLRDESHARSPIAKFHMYHTLCHYASLIQDPLLSLRYGQRHLEIFDAEHEATRHELDYYITLLFNISVVTLFFGDANGIKQAMQRWEELPRRFAGSMTPQRELKWQLYDMEMTIRRNALAGRFDEVVRLLPRITKLSAAPHPYTPVYRDGVLYFVALSLHAAGNSRQALRWLTPLVTDEKVEYRRYRLLLKAFLLRIVIQSDLGHADVTETLCTQLQHFFARQGRETDPEAALPGMFTLLMRTPHGPARRELLRKTARHLSDAFCRPGHWFTAYEHIGLFAWLRSGETRRDLRETLPETLEVLRKKARSSFS